MRGGWELMAHGVIFVDYNQQGGPRGAGKAESVNWGMLMEQHQLGVGHNSFSGDVFRGIADLSASRISRTFPDWRDLSRRTAGRSPASAQCLCRVGGSVYLPLTKKISWELYGGPSAEPALGPVTYVHRASAAELPLAPLSHHLQDSTHTSFGVVTTGFTIDRVKLEASAFNGREPNEERWSIQLAPLDSWSTRASVAPTRDWTAQYSIGRLEHPEALEPGSQWRQTASLEYNRPLAEGSWATSLIWGRVPKIATGDNLNSYLLESTLNFRRRELRILAAGVSRQGRTLLECDAPALFPPALLSYRSLYLRRRAGLSSRPGLATRAGSRSYDLLETRRPEYGLRQLSGIFSSLSPHAAGPGTKSSYALK